MPQSCASFSDLFSVSEVGADFATAGCFTYTRLKVASQDTLSELLKNWQLTLKVSEKCCDIAANKGRDCVLELQRLT